MPNLRVQFLFLAIFFSMYFSSIVNLRNDAADDEDDDWSDS